MLALQPPDWLFLSFTPEVLGQSDPALTYDCPFCNLSACTLYKRNIQT